MGAILGAIFSAMLGRLLAWFKQSELEAQTALAEELKQHAASVEAAGNAQVAAIEAIAAHQEAAVQVTELSDQLAAIKKWNEKSKDLKRRARGLKRTA